ncbi:hypothetical protein BGX31_008967 [Mortierella sp. GBA43]|nr:hypothetical protein BGX31_008967 [Mortierella sp. GBA43]
MKTTYTVEQHIARALFKGQNYSAPLDFSKKANGGTQRGSVSSTSSGESGNSMSDTEANLSDGQGSCSSLENAKPKPILRSRNKGLDPEQGAPTTNTKAKAAAAAAMAAEMKEDADSSMFGAYSFSSMATLGPHSPIPSKENERSLVILSVGCGNTQWATEMALAHPRSAVHAINVSQNPSLPPVPESAPNFDLENLFFYNLDDNSLRIPFASNSVDYIHVRRFLPNVSKSKYLAFMRELVRVLKVGGYIELVELDQRLRGSGVDSCWPSYWTLIGFDKMGIDTSLALNLAGILRSLSGVEVTHRSSVSMPVGIHGGRLGLAAELLCWRSALTIRPWLMRQAMLSGSEFDDLLERARQETRTLKSYQVCHVAVARKTASGTSLAF